MRVLVTKLQKVECVAFAPEGAHLFASGLHASSLDYGDKGIDVFDLAGAPEPVKRLYDARGVQWFAPMPGGRVAVALKAIRGYETELTVLEWGSDRGYRLDADPWRMWTPCGVSSEGRRLVAAL